MNKLSKFFLILIMLLIIVLGITIYHYIQNVNTLLNSNEQIYLITKAINDAGFELQMKEDGTCMLREK